MRVFETLEESPQPTAVALGCFDGVHRGHRRVISGAVQGWDSGLTPTVFTFAGSPLRDLCGKGEPMLQTNEEKIELLEQIGIRQVYLVPFGLVRQLSAEEFVEEVLERTLHARRVCCGFNFHFGRGGEGNSAMLENLCARRRIQTVVTPAVTSKGENVSSTRIRRLVEAGEMERAAAMLGRNFGFCFEVVHGRRLGRELGTPTINQVFPDNFVLPKFGVYASAVRFDGKCYVGVTNVGVKPTVGAERPLAETWIPDYSGDLYGRRVRVELLRFLRPERKFSDLEELKNAILSDGKNAREIMERFFLKDMENQ